MSYPWSVYKTFVTAEILTAADLNSSFTAPVTNSIPANIDDYSANAAQMQSTADPYPAGAESLAATLAGELERIRYVVAQITGETHWYIDPDVTLATAYTALTGTYTFAGAKTFSTAVTINPTTNQLVLGVTTTTTLSATAPTASRVYTIPDAGADADFVLARGNQTIIGTKTFSDAVVLSSGVSGDLSVAGATTLTGALTATGGLVGLFGYRRPNLRYIDAVTVDVEANTGTANQTTIVFPDGTIRSVTENSSVTHKYRRFIITATAEYTTGTEDSGLYTGLSEAVNTWYAIYAVKSTIDATKFVLVGTTSQPTQANFATLSSNFGTNGWVYLGMIRNGDQVAATGDICNFLQTGSETMFTNAINPAGALLMTGIKLASGTNSASYTYSSGTDNTGLPVHFTKVTYADGNTQANASTITISNTDATLVYWKGPGALGVLPVSMPASNGCKATDSAGGGSAHYIALAGWTDPVLESPYSAI